jgi:hypothetical protein
MHTRFMLAVMTILLFLPNEAFARSPQGGAASLAERPPPQGEAIPPDSIETLIGRWSGGIEQGGAVVLRLVVDIVKAASGAPTATLSSPDQGTSDIPITALELRGDSVRFDVVSLGGKFRGGLTPDRTAMTGVWTQGATSIAMKLSRADEEVSFARPQDPLPPFPYRERDVAYVNTADGTRLTGTLTLPPGGGPFPAVLLISGSGPQDRNGALMGHRPFLVLADHLTRQGIAVLRVDDRGVGGSTGDFMNAALPDRVADSEAGVTFLRSHAEVDPMRVGIVGYSEGGWVAREMAARPNALAFVVLLAAPAVSPLELLLGQARAILQASGEPLVEEQLALTRRTFELIRAESENARADAAVRDAMRDWLEALPPDHAAMFRTRAASETYRTTLNQTLRIQTTPWFRGLLAHEPVALESLRVPVLSLFGERDLQVPASQSAPPLAAAWAAHPDATVCVLPELNHFFQHARTGLPSEYTTIDETFAPQALEIIGQWLEDRIVHGASSASGVDIGDYAQAVCSRASEPPPSRLGESGVPSLSRPGGSPRRPRRSLRRAATEGHMNRQWVTDRGNSRDDQTGLSHYAP